MAKKKKTYRDYLEEIARERNLDTKKELADFESFVKENRPIEAPIRSDLATEKKGSGIFNSGLFDDGWRFGDVTKTLVATSKDISGDISTGLSRMGESILVDAPTAIVGGAANLFGADEFAEKAKAFQKRNLVEELKLDEKLSKRISPANGVLNLANSLLNKNDTENVSVLGDEADAFVQTASQVGATAALQYVGVPWQVTTGLNSFGSATEEAFNEDATYGEALSYGGINAGLEIILNKLTGGLKFEGKGLIDNGIKEQVLKRISNGAAKTFAQYGMDMAGEGLEETLTEIGSNIAKKLTYADEKTWGELLVSDEAVYDYIRAFVTGGLISGGFNAKRAYNSVKTGRDYETGLTGGEQSVIDAEITNRTTERQKQIAEQQKNEKLEAEIARVIEEETNSYGGELPKAKKQALIEDVKSKIEDVDYSTIELDKKELKEIRKQANEALERGEIDTFTIENTLFQDSVLRMRELDREMQTADDTRKTEIQAEIDQLQGEVNKTLESNGKLLESYRQKELKNQPFEREITDRDSDKAKSIIEQAKKYGFNNTRRSQESVDLLIKTAEDSDYDVVLINNEELENKGNFDTDTDIGKIMAKIREKKSELKHVSDKTKKAEIQAEIDQLRAKRGTIDGFVTSTGKLVLNVDSPKYVESLVGHEVKHILEKNKYGKEYEKFIKKFAETKGVYEDIRADVASRYKNVTKDIDGEVTARLTEDYIFNDQEFVNKLSVEQPNIFKQMYDYIKHVYKMATAGSKEARQLEKAKRMFEKAYREMGKTTTGKADSNLTTEADSNTKYSFAGVNSKTADLSMKEKAVEMQKQGVDPYTIWEETGWKYANDHKWRYEIDDSKAIVRPSGDAEFLSDPDYIRMNDLFQKFMSAKMTKEEANEYSELSKKFEGRKVKFLSHILSHGDLFAAYPQLKTVGIEVVKYAPGLSRASHDGDRNIIRIRDDVFRRPEELKKVLLHEVQHAVQAIESFERGGNLDSALNVVRGDFYNFLEKVAPERIEEAEKKDEAEGGERHIFALLDEFIKKYYNLDEITNEAKNEFYKNLMGEREAIAVTARLKLSEAEKRKVYPNYDEGAFVRGNDDGRDGISNYPDTHSDKVFNEETLSSGVFGDNYTDPKRDVQSRNKFDSGSHDSVLETKVPNEGAFFNAKKEDIRFSLSAPVEETKDLMAVHNLKQEELLAQLDWGGMPMPSIAITNPDIVNHTDFGDVSLIMKKEAIDPKKSKYNKVYSRDAYTPTFPYINYEADSQAAERISEKVKSLYNDVPEYYQRSLKSLRDKTNMEEMLNREGGEQKFIEKNLKDYGVKQLYLAEKGQAVPIVIKRIETEMTDYQKEMHQYVIEKLGNEIVQQSKAPGVSGREWYANYGEQIKDAYYDLFIKDGFSKEDARDIVESEKGLYWTSRAREAADFIRTGGTTIEEKPDFTATNKQIDEAIADSDFEQWAKALFKGIEGLSGIRNNKDTFTPSGNRRGFKALHDPVTLENVVKAMRGDEAQTGQGAMGLGNMKGASAKEYRSIKDLKDDSGKIGILTEEENKANEDYISDRLFEIAQEYANGKDTIDARNALVEAVANYESRTGIKNYLKQFDYVYSLKESVVDDIIELRDFVRNLPTPYFESKPRRAVSFDEVGAFIIPNNADAALKQKLLEAGYSIAEYNPDIEGDRQNVVNQFEKYKFSLSSPGDIAPINRGRTRWSDIMVPETETIAPIKETATDPTDIAPVKKEVEEPTEEKEERTLRKEIHKGYIDKIRDAFSKRGYNFDDVLSKAKSKSTFSSVDNTPQRFIEKSLGYKEGQILNDLTTNKTALNESEGIKWLNSFTDRKNGLLAQIAKEYNIKPNSKEDAAAQMYGEGFYLNDAGDLIKYGDVELALDFPDATVRNNIKKLATDPRIRQIYDETLDSINASRKRNGYPEIPRRDNYFLHFRAMEDTFSKLGLPFNPNDIRAKDLPTDLNGMTADLKPGQPYFGSAKQRKGLRTSHSLIGGMERYLGSAKNQIYHIDDIQILRALRNYVADMYGQANGLEGLDALTEEEAEARVKQVYDAHLSNFAKFLNEQANVLAGKTSLTDRGLEGVIGRRGITTLDTINSQVGKNMIGFNVSSSLTNLVSTAQAFAKSNKYDSMKALAQTLSNRINSIYGKSDGFVENDPTMIRRKGAQKLSRTPFEKVSDIGYGLMSGIDSISSEFIIRAKYNELTRKGMSDEEAHIEAGKWASRLLGDRSLGQQPHLYNSKMLGLFTKFQLEVRNQLDSQFYDTIQEANVSTEQIQDQRQRNAVKAAKITSTFVQLAVFQHLFGKAFESIAGYNPAFDIIGVLIKTLGFDDDEGSEDTALDNLEQGFLELLGDLPYTSTLTGGRIPIASALPVEQLITGKDDYGNDKSRWDTIKETAPYYVLPGGYGQIKKTTQGLGMFDSDLPVSGSYTDSGNLRFPVEDTPLNRLQAGIFGQWASENAGDYFDNEREQLEEKQIQEYKDLDLPISDYWKYREGLKKQKTTEDKFNYIAGLDLPADKKNIMINNEVDRKETVDLINYDDFGSYEEFDFAVKNPEKYTVSKAVGSYGEYKTYTDALKQIAADKDSDGKTISGSRKTKVADYINSLDADYGSKLILFKSEYPADDRYNNEIVEYLNNRGDISYDEMVTILTELDFMVDAKGSVRW